ncbi:Ras family protein [Teladorsagia circumcincta]|uniref:Ras family protein n=1 Tax=Teladorsagia circumcincta TaxID=45464 RepID=A0A2G9V4N5_TELCI|nr:Ras family protein [Teladorsagia circumcincta]
MQQAPSWLDNATLSCEGRHGIAPMGLTERMRLGGKSNHSEYRFAHMTSITVETRHRTFVIDLIDAEFEDDHSIAHTSYMRAADAAILLYSCSDSASLLAAMSIHRQLAAVSETRKPCVLLANVIDGISQRYVTREMGEKTARNIRATYLETNLLVQDGNVSKVIG